MNNNNKIATLQYELNQQIPESALALAKQPPYVDSTESRSTPDISVENELVLVEGKIPDHRLYQSETFQKLLKEQQKSRHEKLKQHYEDLGRPSSIIVMMFCKNYFSMFENWLKSCEKNGIQPVSKLIVFCLDEEAFRRTTDMGVKCFFFDPDLYAPAGKSKAFSDEWFRNTIIYKNAVIADALELGASVLFQDTDLIWLKDPFEYLETNAEHYDMQIMYDGPNIRGRPVYGNTGFIYLQSNTITKALFETGLRNSASILRAGGHQFVFMKIVAFFLNHQMIRLHILPEHFFLNGHLFNLKQGVLPPAGHWQREGIVLHYSWTGTLDEKLRKLKKFGIDYRDEIKPEQSPNTNDHQKMTPEITTEEVFSITLYLKDDEPLELACEKSSPILSSILKTYFQSGKGGNDPDIIHLQLMEEDEVYDLFLRSSQITRIEIFPPLEQQLLNQLVGS